MIRGAACCFSFSRTPERIAARSRNEYIYTMTDTGGGICPAKSPVKDTEEINMTMKRSLSVLLVLCMALSRLLCGMSVYAEGGTPAESPAFEQSVTVDGVIITVKAQEGVFPADAVLWAENVTNAEQEKIGTAVEEALDAGKKVGASYAFDVKVLDAAGHELQPPEGSDVRISFGPDRVNDSNLEPEIYHITESEAGGRLSAEKLESEADRSAATVAADTDGFSFYSVVFTYEQQNYTFDSNEIGYAGNYSVRLDDILSACYLSGDVTNAVVSDTEFLSVGKNGSGYWMVTVRKYFPVPQTLTVTINRTDYHINVSALLTGGEVSYVDENGTVNTCYDYEVFSAGSSAVSEGWWVLDSTTGGTVPLRVTVSGNVDLIIADGVDITFEEGIHVPWGSSLTIYGQSGQTGTL